MIGKKTKTIREKDNLPFDFPIVTEKPLDYDEEKQLPMVWLEEADFPSEWKDNHRIRPCSNRKLKNNQ